MALFVNQARISMGKADTIEEYTSFKTAKMVLQVLSSLGNILAIYYACK